LPSEKELGPPTLYYSPERFDSILAAVSQTNNENAGAVHTYLYRFVTCSIERYLGNPLVRFNDDGPKSIDIQ
jgi:hypothetical protein